MKTTTLPIPVQFTTSNFLIVIAGALILAVGLHRMFPLQINRAAVILNGPLALMLVAGIALLTWRHDPGSFMKWGEDTAKLAGRFLPLMILLVLVMAIGGVITKIHETAIQSFLLNHRIVGPFVAALITPTSNALVPVVESSWKVRDLQPMCLYYMQASVQMSIPLFMLRQMGFRDSSAIPAKMYAMGVVVSIATLLLMKPTFWLTEALCEYSGAAWTTVQANVRALL